MNIIFRKRTKLSLTALLAGLVLLTLGSCKSNDISYSQVYITHFGFDSFPAFKDYTFYIDNFAHRIYNPDSFPYQSEVNKLFPTVTAGSADGSFTMNGKEWSNKDSLDFSTCPVQMVFTAANGTDKYTYDIYVNVHRQDPDSLQMHRVGDLPAKNEYRVLLANGQFVILDTDGTTVSMYRSSNGRNWEGPLTVDIPLPAGTKVAIKSLSCLGITAFLTDEKGGLYSSRLLNASGDYSSDGLRNWTKLDNAPHVTTLMGILQGRTYPNGDTDPDALLSIIEKNDTLHLARFLGHWADGQSNPLTATAWYSDREALPENFPVKDFACCDNYTQTGLHFITLLGGVGSRNSYCNSTWSTMSSDGTGNPYWANISTDHHLIGEQNNASLFYYDDRLFMFGGKHSVSGSGTIQDTVLYVSTDQGLSWEVADERLAFRQFSQTSNCRQIISNGLYIWVFANHKGKEGLWEGYINKIMFD